MYALCARAAVGACSWKTTAGPTRIHLRAFGYVSAIGMQRMAEFLRAMRAAAYAARRSDIECDGSNRQNWWWHSANYSGR
eukprot:1241367-Pyramimonas_sp.AAC.1